MLEEEVNRFEAIEEYKQSVMFYTEGQLKQTQFILSEMKKMMNN